MCQRRHPIPARAISPLPRFLLRTAICSSSTHLTAPHLTSYLLPLRPLARPREAPHGIRQALAGNNGRGGRGGVKIKSKDRKEENKKNKVKISQTCDLTGMRGQSDRAVALRLSACVSPPTQAASQSRRVGIMDQRLDRPSHRLCMPWPMAHEPTTVDYHRQKEE